MGQRMAFVAQAMHITGGQAAWSLSSASFVNGCSEDCIDLPQMQKLLHMNDCLEQLLIGHAATFVHSSTAVVCRS